MSCRRQLQGARLPLEEAHPHYFFELLHLMAHRRWREGKLIRRSFEALVARRYAECTQVAQRWCSG
jgi:hypothetical protein